MKCPKCGHVNPEHSVYCGMCSAELSGDAGPSRSSSIHQESTIEQASQPTHMTDLSLESIVSIAVNIRRIFIILALGLLVTMSVHLFAAVVVGIDDPEVIELTMRIWYLVTAVLIALGLFYAVKVKRITLFGDAFGRQR